MTGLPRGAIPLVLFAFGVGTVLGTALGGRLADRALFRSLVGGTVSTGILPALVPVAARRPVTVVAAVLLLSTSASVMVVCLQMRLVDVAGDAQTLGAALNHSALNVADALGAWLGGVVIAAGLGYSAPGAVGAVLAAAGLGVLGWSAALHRGELRTDPAALPGACLLPPAAEPVPCNGAATSRWTVACCAGHPLRAGQPAGRAERSWSCSPRPQVSVS